MLKTDFEKVDDRPNINAEIQYYIAYPINLGI